MCLLCNMFISVSRLLSGDDDYNEPPVVGDVATYSTATTSTPPTLVHTVVGAHETVSPMSSLSKSPVEHNEIMPHARALVGQLTLNHQQTVHNIQPTLSITTDSTHDGTLHHMENSSSIATPFRVHTAPHVRNHIVACARMYTGVS